MEYKTTVIPVQTRADGSVLSLHAYSFSSGVAGPKIYLQANLHGPEVFGTALLVKLVQELLSWEKIPGTLIIVPCANPIGVQEVGYNTQLGRWNPQNGTNWNRIFGLPQDCVWRDEKEEQSFYENLLKEGSPSIENHLAANLRLLSAASDYVVDIHTTGIENMEHIFTLRSFSKYFEGLSTEYHLVQEGEYAGETFEESHSYPFRKKEEEERRKSCTWELSHHGKIEETEISNRLKKLLNWLHFVWGFDPILPEKKPILLNDCAQLLSPEGGYYAWKKSIGTFVKKGEVYAEIYHPENATFTHAVAFRDFYLISKYGVGAVGEGEQIGWIGY